LTTVETPQGIATIAIDEEFQNGPNLPTVAAAIINKRNLARASCAALARHISGRRRFVDPTTCEKDYAEAEMEFMSALQLYKQAGGRSFPTWCEVLEVLGSWIREGPSE
jgi:hypothetical protein